MTVKRRAVAGQLDVHGAPVGVAALAREGLHGDAGPVEQQPAVLVVDVGQPEPGPLGGEQGRLGGEVVVDVGVEVEVVAAQVEEGRDVEDDPVDPAEDEGVAGDLHRAGDDALLAHHREEAVQVRGLGGGERRLDVDAVDAGADGADDGGGYAGLLEARLQQPGRRGLALGAGHADHGEVGGGLAVEVGRHATEDRAGVLDDQHRRAGRQTVGAVGVGEHGDGSRGEGLVGEVGAVRAGAREGGVQVAGEDALGAQGDPGDRDVEVAVTAHGGQGAEPVDQVGQSGHDGLSGAGAGLGVADHVARLVTTRRAGARACRRSAGRRSGPGRSRGSGRTPDRRWWRHRRRPAARAPRRRP